MGNRIIAVDPIIGEFVRPSINAYTSGTYRGACHLLDALNGFLLAFGAGISDMPRPQPYVETFKDRLQIDFQYQKYYEKWLHPLMKALGFAIKSEVLRVIDEKEAM